MRWDECVQARVREIEHMRSRETKELANRAHNIHRSSDFHSTFTILVIACHAAQVPSFFNEAKRNFYGEKDLESEIKD